MISVALLLHILLGIGYGGDNPSGNPVELGRVQWHRDFDQAMAEARHTGRPVLALFQEVPGCATCVTFGNEPLSHPLLVEAMETEFVPLAIMNNRPGRDAKIRDRYQEPAWNFPVMRFLGADAKDIVPRRDRIWTTAGVANRMVKALETAKRSVPGYLRLVAMAEGPTKQATFSMHCFWEGEARLGRLDGVVGTHCAWRDGREIVEVEYRPDRLPYGRLVDAAQRAHVADRVYAHDDRQFRAASRKKNVEVERTEGRSRPAKPSDQTHALNRSPLRYLPLTRAQATKVNADIRLGDDPRRWLSPRQLALLGQVATVLEKNRKALDGLRRPADDSDLTNYEERLRAALQVRQQAP